jgi:predicted transposase YbfD/YdcC
LPKKTLASIVEGNNSYVVQLKGNSKLLYDVVTQELGTRKVRKMAKTVAPIKTVQENQDKKSAKNIVAASEVIKIVDEVQKQREEEFIKAEELAFMSKKTPLSYHKDSEKGHGRHSTWETTTYSATELQNIKPLLHLWKGLNRIVCVCRTVKFTGLNQEHKNYIQKSYYLSNLTMDAADFYKGIRGHWGIENGLHYTKDVVFGED